MPNSSDLFLAVGGVFLVTWYGLTRLSHNRRGMPAPARPGTPEFRRCANIAWEAEFGVRKQLVETFPGGSVFCPDCRTEFAAGTLYCLCGAETVELDELENDGADGDAAEPQQSEELICVHVTEHNWKASLLASFLESHDISCATRSTVPPSLTGFGLAPMNEVRLFVPASEAQRAKLLLTEYT